MTPGPWLVDINGNVCAADDDMVIRRDADNMPLVVAEVYERDDAEAIAGLPGLLEAVRLAVQCHKALVFAPGESFEHLLWPFKESMDALEAALSVAIYRESDTR
jgi:hypothetical protein